MVILLLMANTKDNSQDLEDWTKLDFSNNTRRNKRIGVRYVREDIAASVCKINTFSFFGFLFNKEMVVELIDISSKGVLIATSKKLRINKKINLTLTFEDAKTFKISAKVVRKAHGAGNQYGLKFDRLNNDLGDYLLATQRKLVFK
jgi:PilZ domain